MRGKLLLNILFLIPLVSYAQSRPETESWILGKLIKYNSEENYIGTDLSGMPSGRTRRYNYQIYFQDSFLIVQHKYRVITRDYPYSSTGFYETVEVVNIPVYDIIEVYSQDNPYSQSEKNLTFKVNPRRIKAYSNDVQKPKNYFDDPSGLFSSFSLPFNFEEENDLISRLNKAFIHLRPYYPRPKKIIKEIF